MSLLEKVTLIPRILRTDSRGWFLKVIDGKEEGLPNKTGEIYLTMALPNECRGGHYHLKASEWFTVVQGTAIVTLADISNGQRKELTLLASEPQTLFVPPGVAHIFKNPQEQTEPMIMVAYTNELYEPQDTIPYPPFLE